MHVELATAAEKVPTKHEEQVVAARFEYLPATQSKHLVAAAAAYFPLRHAPDVCERPEVEQ